MTEEQSEQGSALDAVLELGAAWSAVSRVLQRALHDADISLEQALAVVQIATTPQPLMLSQLAARLFQQPQSVTSLMDRIERSGWAARMHDLPDRRAIRVEITESGAAKADEIGALLLAAAERLIGSLDGKVTAGLGEGVVALYEACRNLPGVRLPELAGE